ncbi:hypothetical protein MM221_07135 [Salipaludibacillus sp. LMS25]|jgi:hypothetical protein|uniref:hypothetical protein n=1 Tax=Salipaludibacillus sp. LMS25 TaxID=2924031 RepID=UPI0020D1C483|nr:hypothetical protein [Salipaludibacillus sp. LMS25]UTR16314.1 hypothetical protein MM221_07135 [Salipaludibacillus sp. LMS25]
MIVIPIVMALYSAYLIEGMVHRELKTDNRIIALQKESPHILTRVIIPEEGHQIIQQKSKKT